MLNAQGIQLLVLLIYIIFFVKVFRGKYKLTEHILIFLFFVYVAGLLSVTLFPMPVHRNIISAMRYRNYISHNFIPLKDLLTHFRFFGFHGITNRIFLGNLILLAPAGFFIPIIFKRVSTLSKTVLVGLGLSLTIESLQLVISLILGFAYRSANIDDVILNTLGALLGFIALQISLPILAKFIDVSHLQKERLKGDVSSVL